MMSSGRVDAIRRFDETEEGDMPVGGGDNAWDEAWKSGLAGEPTDFDSATLQNHVDELKRQFLGREVPSRGSAIEVGCGSARLLLRVGRGTALDLFALDSSVHAL